MTQTTKPEFVIRAYQGEHIAQMIKLGDGIAQLCEIQPRPIFIVTAKGPETPEEVLATFETLEAAKEAAEALTAQLRAELHTDGNGLKLATVNGATIQ